MAINFSPFLKTLGNNQTRCSAMFRSNWDLVSPFTWLDSLANEEEFMGQSFDELYPSTRVLLFPRQRQRQLDEQMTYSEGESMEKEEPSRINKNAKVTNNFFDDLPAGAKLMDTQIPANLSPPDSKAKDGFSFCTYSYSTCLTVDDNGCRVNSTRRRYEDSDGRLKAQHKRQIGTCELESTWKRSSDQDEGSVENKVSSGSVEGFEKAWKHTPFGVAEEQAKAHGAKQQNVLPDQPLAQELP
ncbi:uncharacterized protein PHALS_10334 [Plasmopara halstedii]|uniref:Uncharacterized protein n=1 Tax=Plasmopara halstedii TaxID=4781 RepID=A0A0P1AGD3_PLAHL|nr:uncharacterized protein PHALS_10334 [Plasmopara halstedii]CEG40117.1 hypothetical protein PHALS_10334 [Plasmopara halstedii]|eukprot:XP_024576486.1 hypothetical protein PHALS_10334 [Plasmopara halstedii]